MKINKEDFFPLPLQEETIDETRKLISLFKFLYKGIWIIAPKGFIYNGASIPRFLWGIFGGPFSGKNKLASLFHDLLCDDPDHELYAERHNIFKEIQKIKGKPWLTRGAMFNAIVAWGWITKKRGKK